MRAVAPSAVALSWFDWYTRGYLQRHFHSLRLQTAEVDLPRMRGPLIVFLNHASWWDPLVALTVTRHLFPTRWFAGPIEAKALERYGILRRLGFFGVESGTLRGAKSFLRTSLEVLRSDEGGLCFTPQGRFVDGRERPLKFQPGLGQLARRLEHATLLPMAIEYPFWEERSPEILVRFGAPIVVEEGDARTAQEWTQRCETRLAETLDALAADSMARAVDRFQTLLSGRSGVGGIYDLWRKVRARMRGEKFTPEHSGL